MSERRITRKRVRIEVHAEFVGDYYDLDECPAMLDYWIDGAFNDRDDLQNWRVYTTALHEEELDSGDGEV